MKEELVGHITSNPNKMKILELFRNKESIGESDVSKYSRIPSKIAMNILKELLNDGLIEKSGERLTLSELGDEILKEIKGI